nr:DUF2793 domain-containing protein [Mesorhizobium sp.]
MEYKAPYGSVDPDAPYVDKDVPGAIAGSKVPRQAIEHPQKEIANTIDFFLGTGNWRSAQSGGDLGQLRKSIQRATFGGNADLVVQGWQTTPPGAPVEGHAYIVKSAGTGAWAGQSHKIAVWIGGAWMFLAPTTGVQANYKEGVKFVAIWFDGTIWATLASLNAITVPTTINVSQAGSASPANPLAGDAFDTIANALAWLQDWSILGTGSVSILLTAGVHSVAAQTIARHPYADKISVTGANLPGAFPDNTDVVASIATSRTNLRAKMGTIISISGGITGFFFDSSFGGISKIMFDHNGAGGGSLAAVVQRTGSTNYIECIFFGCKLGDGSGAGIAASVGGSALLRDCLVAHCDTGGRALQGGYIDFSVTNISFSAVLYCGYGLLAGSNGQISVIGAATFSNHSNAALSVSSNSLIRLSGSAAVGFSNNQINTSANGGRIEVLSPTSMGVAVGGTSHVATLGGYILVPNQGSITSSPANNTVGNNNSYVRIY